MDKKANIGGVVLVGLVGLIFVLIVFAAFSGPFEQIRDTFNESYTTEKEHKVAGHINTAWRTSFFILTGVIVFWVVISSLTRQSREYEQYR